MNRKKQSIISKLTSNKAIIHLAYARNMDKWLWVGYVGQGQYDYSVIESSDLITSITDMVNNSDLKESRTKPASIQGLSLVFYELSDKKQ